MSIEHFLHKHTLFFIHDGNEEVECEGCEKSISGSCYACTYCDFYLHSECSKLPQQIDHFFHPCPLVLKIYYYTCNACFLPGSGFCYRCFICHFNMHVECVLQPAMELKGEGVIQHFTHWHPLTLVDANNKKDEEENDHKVCSCAICETISYDSTYACQQCNFFLHKSCMTKIPRKINHFFHQCPLILLPYPLYACGGCSRTQTASLTYSCGKCRFKLDVKCGLLPTVESEGAAMIQHFSHGHPLKLCRNKIVNIKDQCRCRACGDDCLEQFFACSRSCNFFLHKACAELPKEIHHPFHTLHPLHLTFLQHAGACFECTQPFDLFLLAYHCYWCDFNLHKDCAQFTPSFKHRNYLHALTLCDKRPSPFKCNICSYKANKLFLRCMGCGFNIHLYCLPSAPKIIKHNCHTHSLTLTKSPLPFELNFPEDPDGSEDEFYCDVCEERREKKEPVYYCTECKFIAEVGCVISELIPSYISPEDQNALSSRAISKDEENSATDPSFEMLNNEIGMLSAKSKLLIEELEPVKVEIEPLKLKLGQLQGKVQEIEAELDQTTKKLDDLEVKRFLRMYQPKHSTKEYMNSANASTSGVVAASKPI